MGQSHVEPAHRARGAGDAGKHAQESNSGAPDLPIGSASIAESLPCYGAYEACFRDSSGITGQQPLATTQVWYAKAPNL